jgi:hypothetical protein
MTSLDYQVLSRRIYSNFPVIGWLLRRWAAWQLAKDDGSGEAVAILAEVVTRSRDRVVREMALAVLSRLKNKEIIDQFCKKWMENPNGLLENIIRKKSYEPNEVSTKALFYFLLGSWQKYEDLDFDQRLLTKAYYAASENTQKLVADKAKKAGRIEWIQILTNTRQGFNSEKMTDKDWIDFVDILAANPDRKEIWRFLYNAPVIYSKKLLDRLVKISYKWFREDEEIMVKNLLNLSAKFNERDLILNSFLFLQEPMYQEILDGSLEGNTDSVRCLAISPDGRILASGSMDGTIRLWSLPNGNHLKTLEGNTNAGRLYHDVTSLAISPNGHILASGSFERRSGITEYARGEAKRSGSLDLWSLPDGNHLKTLSEGDFECLAISNHILASGFMTNGISSGRKGYSSKEYDSSKRPITTIHLRLWSLFNSRYINMPLSLITNSDISKIKSKIEEYKIDEVVRSTFEFNLALIALRKQFDIDIEDSSNDIHFSEFDIEIDG